MGKVGAALSGVLASAVVATGAWGAEIVSHNAQENAVMNCHKNVGDQALKGCISEAKDLYNHDDTFGIIEFGGVIALIGTGYLAYKAVKEEVGTTGIIEDFS